MIDICICIDRNKIYLIVKFLLSVVVIGDDEVIGFGIGRGFGRVKDFFGFLFLKYIV